MEKFPFMESWYYEMKILKNGFKMHSFTLTYNNNPLIYHITSLLYSYFEIKLWHDMKE
jgi:hypothetical protein